MYMYIYMILGDFVAVENLKKEKKLLKEYEDEQVFICIYINRSDIYARPYLHTCIYTCICIHMCI
jgi:hypothetical protein